MKKVSSGWFFSAGEPSTDSQDAWIGVPKILKPAPLGGNAPFKSEKAARARALEVDANDHPQVPLVLFRAIFYDNDYVSVARRVRFDLT